MKYMKKIISVFAALTLAMTVPMQAVAAGSSTVQSDREQLTISDTEGFLKFAQDCRLDTYHVTDEEMEQIVYETEIDTTLTAPAADVSAWESVTIPEKEGLVCVGCGYCFPLHRRILFL